MSTFSSLMGQQMGAYSSAMQGYQNNMGAYSSGFGGVSDGPTPAPATQAAAQPAQAATGLGVMGAAQGIALASGMGGAGAAAPGAAVPTAAAAPGASPAAGPALLPGQPAGTTTIRPNQPGAAAASQQGLKEWEPITPGSTWQNDRQAWSDYWATKQAGPVYAAQYYDPSYLRSLNDMVNRLGAPESAYGVRRV